MSNVRNPGVGVRLILGLLVFAGSIWAQTAGTGALVGTVRDATGAVIPSATVTLTSADTAQVRTSTTAADGTYRFSLLPPGNYKADFSATGFKTGEVPAVTIAVTETPVLDQSLQVGTQAEEITVAATTETIQTSNATVGTVVAQQSVVALPLTTRNYTNLLALTAGANAPVANATALGRGNLEISVNGAPSNFNAFQMDGVSISSFGGTGALTEGSDYPTIGIPNPDALQEFKIQTSLYDAGYGRNAGANVNVITKSGTNQYHGTMFEFFRNTDLNANDFFRNRTCGLTPAVCANAGGNKLILNQNQFGGVVGGPIKKDKLFFFTSYQQTWQKNGVATQGYATGINLPVVPLGSRTAAGWQAALGAIYCKQPTTVGGMQVACDGSNINPVALKLLQATLPTGNNIAEGQLATTFGAAPATLPGQSTYGGTYFLPGSTTGAIQAVNYSLPAYDQEYQGLGNLDYLLNSKNTISSRFFKSLEPQTIAFSANSPPGTPATVPWYYDTGILRLTTIVSNSFVNEVRGSVERSGEHYYQFPAPNSYANVVAPGDPAIEGPNGNFLSPGIPFYPVVNITGLYSAGGGTSTGQTIAITQVQWADQISWTHGKHSVRAGVEIERIRWTWIYRGLSQGVEAFQSFSDFLIGLPGNCGVAVLGACNGSTTGSSISNTTNFDDRTGPNGDAHGYRGADANSFVQDDFKVSQHLTLNLGVRWEYDGLPSDKYGNAVTVAPYAIDTVKVPATTFLCTPGIYCTPPGATSAGWIVPPNYSGQTPYGPLPAGVIVSKNLSPAPNGVPWDDFAPRVGFAWQPFTGSSSKLFGGEKFVMRGGFGFFYNRISADTMIHELQESSPFSEKIDQSGIGNSFSSEAAPFQPTPLGSFPLRWVNFTPGISVFDESSSITAGGISDRYVTPLTYSWNINLQYAIQPSLVLEVGYNGSHGIHQPESTHYINEPALATPGNPVNTETENTVNNAPLRVPYLGFGVTGLQMAMTDGSYKSDSIQVTLRKNLSHGLNFQAAYSLTRAFNNTLNSGDPMNLGQQYGLNTSYRPQRLVINYSYQLPGNGLKGIPGILLGGWSVSGVTQVQDGTPFNITDNRGASIYGMNLSGVLSRAQMAPGATYASIPTTGGVEARLGGASGGPGYINGAAFTTIPVIGVDPNVAGTGGTGWGNMGPTAILGPGQFNFDATLQKSARVGGIHENATVQFRVELFNMFNHPQFSNPAAAVNSAATLGQITSTSVNPRLIQLALKYVF